MAEAIDLNGIVAGTLPDPTEREHKITERSDQYFAPMIRRFMAVDLSGVQSEPVLDLSKAPE